ncbi:MAG: class I SAM-dependent methyltransferase, partial [Acidihalobacter sp.]
DAETVQPPGQDPLEAIRDLTAGRGVDVAIESAGKKAAFLRMVAGTLGLPATVHQSRIESIGAKIAVPEIVTARALAPLPKLLDLAEPWLSGGAMALFQKGRDYRREVEASRYAWSFDLVEHSSVTEPDAAILEIAGLRRQAAG